MAISASLFSQGPEHYLFNVGLIGNGAAVHPKAKEFANPIISCAAIERR